MIADLLTRYRIASHAAEDLSRLEGGLLDLFAGLFHAPEGAWSGQLAVGAGAATMQAMRLARDAMPGCIVLASQAAFEAVVDAADALGMPLDTVAADRGGEMDYASLTAKLAQHRHRQPLIIATAGTPATEAIDDVGRIVAACEQLGIQDRRIHVDSPTAGVALAIAPPYARPSMDFSDGADSITIGTDAFLSTLLPSAVLLVNRRDGVPMRRADAAGNGHVALLLWSAIARHGVAGLRLRAQRARRVAEYAHQQLALAGWDAWRHDHALTVSLRTPPAAVAERWLLPAGRDGWTRLIATPSVTVARVDAFVADLVRATEGTHPVPRRAAVAVGF
ncbi:pyridoxal-dependent decarboxylase [Hamadaea tsunoensis]|uniref:pyridoxal-dependent decarboxylase n=1 Tax=Hamadaea tsunoensis TaxID=53368 RepID=UPI00146F9EFC|nr:pyridoxal-dependent decarboxylase [Hamadaea tsunoensis]